MADDTGENGVDSSVLHGLDRTRHTVTGVPRCHKEEECIDTQDAFSAGSPDGSLGRVGI